MVTGSHDKSIRVWEKFDDPVSSSISSIAIDVNQFLYIALLGRRTRA